MNFIYTANNKRGKRVRGVLEVATKEEALRQLKEKDWSVVSLVAEEKGHVISFGFISALEKVTFAKHLSVMLRAGVSIDESLRVLSMQSSSGLQSVLKSIRARVEAGERFSDALSTHTKVFNTYFINMVRAGEESGKLVENLEQLAVRFGKDYELRQKAQSAMFYPGLVLGMTGGLAMLLAIFVFPRLTDLFRSFDFELPWYTQVLLWIAHFFVDYGLIVAPLVVIFSLGGFWLIRQPFLAPIVHRLYLTLPIVKKIAISVNTSRFSMVLASLLQSGMPIAPAFQVTASIMGNARFRSVLGVAQSRIQAGEPLSAILEDSHLFSLFVVRMVQVGEETGKLEEVLNYIASYYETELDLTLKNLSTIIEPIMLVVIGASVAGLAISIISPIYQFLGSIQ